jgi:hypothetical protein
MAKARRPSQSWPDPEKTSFLKWAFEPDGGRRLPPGRGVDVNGPKLPFVEEASALSACVGTRCRVVRGALCPPIALFGVGTGGKQGPVIAGRGAIRMSLR